MRTFAHRGIVEGFFGPPWSLRHREEIFRFGAARGMNTYLYAPKDDPYHRARWSLPYPASRWRELLHLIRAAQRFGIDFVYGFHPGQGLCFSDAAPVQKLIAKAERFYDAGVRIFAVLFDDIPSRLAHARDRTAFSGSLARAEATWMQAVLERQPASWRGVRWWLCPSYYTPDPILARTFGAFEPDFLPILADYLPPQVACLWTGPRVVPRTITYAHARRVAQTIAHPLILWDNYPVNDLSMSEELHLGPLRGRDPRLPRAARGYLNNPLLQETLSFIPLATCFDYARRPSAYEPESSWRRAVIEKFGEEALPHWLAIRRFCDRSRAARERKQGFRPGPRERARLRDALDYAARHRSEKWFRELRPWREAISRALG
ncbi:MAG TPA: beta-N-acetylglucosaminidase domain-containing protein [candidate division Zixibacteria bacterium]|nr:beta-N-acetylglucosaminidase domain-containing protein [candidate division Zixibacteria bacterium]